MSDIVEMLVDAAGGNETHVCAIAAAEIERLRELLGETYGYIHIPYGASHEDVAEITDVRRRVREALGE